MSNDKAFKVAGVSAVKGNYKVRFANDMSRVKVLIKTDHTDIELVEMPTAVSKGEAVTFLKTSSLMEKEVYRQAIEAADAKYNAEAAPARTVKVKASKPSLESIKARGTNKNEAVESAPEALM
jgi:hypothetical protein